VIRHSEPLQKKRKATFSRKPGFLFFIIFEIFFLFKNLSKNFISFFSGENRNKILKALKFLNFFDLKMADDR